MTEKQVEKLLELYRQAPDDIELAREKLEQWSDIDGEIAAAETERLKGRIVKLQTLLVSVERAVERLPKIHREIVKLRGMKVPWWKIAKQIKYSERSCQIYYSKALKALADSIELSGYDSVRRSTTLIILDYFPGKCYIILSKIPILSVSIMR